MCVKKLILPIKYGVQINLSFFERFFAQKKTYFSKKFSGNFPEFFREFFAQKFDIFLGPKIWQKFNKKYPKYFI